MADALIRATAANGRIRAVAALTTQVVEEARRRHRTSPTATAALGKALTGGLLLSAILQKAGGRLTIRIIGDGPLGGIVVDAGEDGRVRGYVAHPETHLPPQGGSLDVGGAIGHNGFLYVTHDSGQGHPHTGTVELVSAELGEDFTHYLATSEQIPSAVSLGIFLDKEAQVEVAGGLIVQLMPGAGDEIAWRLEQTMKQLPSFSQLARMYGNLEGIVTAALEGFAVEFLSVGEVGFSCHCSRERVLRAIASLGEREIRAMICEDGKAEVRCHFCNEEYVVLRDQLEELLSA